MLAFYNDTIVKFPEKKRGEVAFDIFSEKVIEIHVLEEITPLPPVINKLLADEKYRAKLALQMNNNPDMYEGTARILGISKRTFFRKIKKYSL